MKYAKILAISNTERTSLSSCNIKDFYSFVDWDPQYNTYRGLQGNFDAVLFVPTSNCVPQCIGSTFFFSVSKTLAIKKLNERIDFFFKKPQKIL